MKIENKTGAPPLLPRRFYKNVQVAPVAGESAGSAATAPAAAGEIVAEIAMEQAACPHFTILLDGRPVKTPARRPLIVPCRALAELIAEEFRAQENTVNPALMPVNRLANTVIDGLSANQQPVREDILRYSAGDMVFYRADSPRELAEKQAQGWDKVLDWAWEIMEAEFQAGTGVMFISQKPEALAAVSAYLRQRLSPATACTPFALAALHVMTCVSGSALLAFMVESGALAVREAWQLAQIEEDWTMAQWGQDAEAAQRRAGRERDFYAAAAVLTALKAE
ncbi:ATP12 family chaperone protein [Candidatus Tokpelaia sp.]|uniref:ATP12 family chaperone protein n=1 Tax=Candidatus Tokpelaia sp. TaxID=2233777 RepID=UPI001239C7CC|nr:ATP12 family protein [Candidatus Tokpelaia sp.]KAA6405549.1 ATPase [Candidatus Tokpelaia sp.]